jgi:hypothetical protein
MTKALQGIAVMGVIGYIGLMLLAEGRSGPNAEGSATERVDVNDAETSATANVVWRGSPYSVVLIKGSYNIGKVGSDDKFNPLMGSNGLRYVYNTQSAAVSKAEQLNNPLAGGVRGPQVLTEEDSTPTDPYERVVNPSDFGFGSSSPAMGW